MRLWPWKKKPEPEPPKIDFKTYPLHVVMDGSNKQQAIRHVSRIMRMIETLEKGSLGESESMSRHQGIKQRLGALAAMGFDDLPAVPDQSGKSTGRGDLQGWRDLYKKMRTT